MFYGGAEKKLNVSEERIETGREFLTVGADGRKAREPENNRNSKYSVGSLKK